MLSLLVSFQLVADLTQTLPKHMSKNKPLFVSYVTRWNLESRPLQDQFDILERQLGHSKIRIAKVLCDVNPEICMEHDVPYFPHIVLYQPGQLPKIYKGQMTAELMQEWLKTNLK
ncbi:Thioredoxin_domain-containing protein [Hexamita inflata]|uniref:Thioredoxin domain-containing protein n=1 Tax=Hexamita inflata TaxID=28002 RepID=A0AA86P5Y8_9EUKA|nr:Thioredoxin domain-containing protein [Hexamita inflata]